MTTTIPPLAQVEARTREAREFSLWHEQCVERLFTESGALVVREPEILGKTPDLLVQPHNGTQHFVVECIARLPDPNHAAEMEERGWHLCGGNIQDLHANVYSRLDHKATKYRAIAQRLPYVIAVYDGTCLNSVQTAVDMMMSPYRPTVERDRDGSIRGRHYNTLWPQQEIPVALFDLYPHLSGLVYSRWPRQHHYLPNPNAERPMDPATMPFADVPPLPNSYHAEGWTPRRATLAGKCPAPPERWERELRHTSNEELHRLYAA